MSQVCKSQAQGKSEDPLSGSALPLHFPPWGTEYGAVMADADTPHPCLDFPNWREGEGRRSRPTGDYLGQCEPRYLAPAHPRASQSQPCRHQRLSSSGRAARGEGGAGRPPRGAAAMMRGRRPGCATRGGPWSGPRRGLRAGSGAAQVPRPCNRRSRATSSSEATWGLRRGPDQL